MKRLSVFIICACVFICAGLSASAIAETVIVMSYAGKVKITPAGKAKEILPSPNMVLKAGDRIKTGRESYMEIAFERKRENIVRIEEKSDVIIKLEGDEKIELIDGEIYTVLKGLKRGEEFQVRTPCAVCGARGTGWNTKTTAKKTDVAVFDDKIFVRGIKPDGSVMEEKYWVNEGFERRIKKFEKPEKMTKMSEKKLKAMKDKMEPPKPPRKPEKKPKKPKAPKKTKEKPSVREKREERVRKIEQIEKKKKAAERAFIKREERREATVDRRDEKRIEALSEKRKKEAADKDRQSTGDISP